METEERGGVCRQRGCSVRCAHSFDRGREELQRPRLEHALDRLGPRGGQRQQPVQHALAAEVLPAGAARAELRQQLVR